jgi:hypothetical protein
LFRIVSSEIDATWNSDCLAVKADCIVEFEGSYSAFVILHRTCPSNVLQLAVLFRKQFQKLYELEVTQQHCHTHWNTVMDTA